MQRRHLLPQGASPQGGTLALGQQGARGKSQSYDWLVLFTMSMRRVVDGKMACSLTHALVNILFYEMVCKWVVVRIQWQLVNETAYKWVVVRLGWQLANETVQYYGNLFLPPNRWGSNPRVRLSQMQRGTAWSWQPPDPHHGLHRLRRSPSNRLKTMTITETMRITVYPSLAVTPKNLISCKEAVSQFLSRTQSHVWTTV